MPDKHSGRRGREDTSGGKRPDRSKRSPEKAGPGKSRRGPSDRRRPSADSRAEKPSGRKPPERQPSGRKSSGERSESKKIRLNRYIAQAGVTSRRKADELIEAGLVKVDGEVVTELGTRVEEGQSVEVNGRLVSPREHVYILVNKAEDVITTTDDEKGRDTVMDLVTLPEKEKAGLYPVGRLDRDTVGVLLLTNDGDLAHRLMHPRYEVTKLYLVRTKDPVKPHEIDLLQRGVDLEDGKAAADQVAYLDPQDPREIGMQLHEGRNRQIRRMMEALGHEVVFLERVNYAGLTADGVRRGRWRRLAGHEVDRLRRLVKLK